MTDEGGGDKRRRRINPEMIAAVAAAVDRAQDRQKEMMARIAPQLEAAANRAQQMAAEIPMFKVRKSPHTCPVPTQLRPRHFSISSRWSGSSQLP
jgi:hypothetical protein